MFKSLFKSKTVQITIAAPFTGKAVSLEEVPDQVFSQKIMGDGLAVIPTNNEVFSPVDGEIISVFPTKHAITIRSKDGLELLIHMGLDTVNLKGEGFQVFVNEGDKISQGDRIGEFDLEKVSTAGYQVITPIIVLNGEKFSIESRKNGETVTGGTDSIMEIKKQK